MTIFITWLTGAIVAAGLNFVYVRKMLKQFTISDLSIAMLVSALSWIGVISVALVLLLILGGDVVLWEEKKK
jgi:hypothetical protein